MQTCAVVLEKPGQIGLRQLSLEPPGVADVVVAVSFSGVSTGTERLLWEGRMPAFPGMGYPLVPGYEAVGEVVEAGSESGIAVGTQVFVPGAYGFKEARPLFGASAARLVVPGGRVTPIDSGLGEAGVGFALAATAQHAIAGGQRPDLIIGHGVLGRLIARLAVIDGGEPPVVWETNPVRRDGAEGYRVIDPADDERRDYHAIYDASGDAALLDTLIGRLARAGEIVLAGFYSDRISFAFAPAFMREARLRTASEWSPGDLVAVRRFVGDGRLSLAGLVSHVRPAEAVGEAYGTAFSDAGCLKLALDWRECS